ncbi:transcriptional regulator [Vibrio coralliilyticus]|uniref:winged helix-turn-helix domain-containing protein n=1 Tax=Vibrio coralliilyticus TaxID=190893 RepID=UPI000BAAA1E7|nr:winged helix-turn-helix domain-containing protein [Vibrio coralliilyticus]PAU36612.1 transcriptional regulator [Vibrio coralliilyticus]
MLEKGTCFIVDEWRFVPNEGQIFFADETVNIDRRLSKLLEFFCQYPGQTHTRDELIEHVWNGTILTDQVVTQAVFELRKVLKNKTESHKNYVVTVPKRGYKFDAEVTVEKLEVSSPSTASEVVESDEEVVAPTTFVADKTARTKRSYLTWALGVVVVLQAGFIANHWANSTSEADHQHQVVDNIQHYESRYVVLNLSPEIEESPELYGMVTKFMEYLDYYSNIRIVNEEPHSKLAAVELSFKLKQGKDGKQKLAMKYYNRVSQQTHLNRRYSTDLSLFHATFLAMLDDVLSSMFIEVPKRDILLMLEEMPRDPQTLENMMNGIGLLYKNFDFMGSLNRFRAAKETSPDSSMVIAVNYIGEVMNVFFTDVENKSAKIVQLNQLYEPALTERLQEGASPRVYEANAIMALTKDDPRLASRILLSMPYQQQSNLTYILLAKAEEARGNIGGARELYLKATQGNSSMRALNLAGPLFFDSNLDPILEDISPEQ